MRGGDEGGRDPTELSLGRRSVTSLPGQGCSGLGAQGLLLPGAWQGSGLSPLALQHLAPAPLSPELARRGNRGVPGPGCRAWLFR